MKHLKSSLADLRHFFDHGITVREIAEPLISFDGDHPSVEVHRFMEDHSFDVVGVRENGIVIGWVRAPDLDSGSIREYQILFQDGDQVSGSSPLLSALTQLKNREALFVTLLGQVGGIITRGDLQKAPVRMWLFGLISLIEMQLLRLIREAHPDGSWQNFLTPNRLSYARNIQKERQNRNTDIHLTDCLQWCDKTTILFKSELLTEKLHIGKSSEGKTLHALEKLRNDLAHSQDIITGRWPELADLALSAEELLRTFEASSIPSTPEVEE